MRILLPFFFTLGLSIFSSTAISAPNFTIEGIGNDALLENLQYSSPAPYTDGVTSGTVTYALLNSLSPFSDLSDLPMFAGLSLIDTLMIFLSDDSSLFSVNSTTGVVSLTPRDFENPSDKNADNIYSVTLIATDSDGNRNHLTWTVEILDQPAVFFFLTGINDASVYENNTYSANQPNISGASIGSITYSLSGNDASAFVVDSTTGIVTMGERDFETPGDANGDNIYEITLIGTDKDNNTASISWTVTILDQPPLVFSMSPIADSQYHQVQYTSPSPSVSGAFRSPLQYSISGDDVALFSLSTNGKVILTGQNFNAPADFNGDNVYEIILTATDKDNNTANATVSVTILNIPPSADSDGDGVINMIELAENTQPNNAASFKDTDRDGTPDALDTDADNDFLLNAIDDLGHDPYADNDGDFVPDYLDADDRGDGTPAACTDLNSNNICALGFPLDPWFDSDQDGIPNHADFDSDNDSIPDVIEGLTDTDSDTIPNYIDTDSDNDGIPDIIESGTNAIDSNFNRIADRFDITITGGIDINLDGIDDNVDAIDSDNDSTPNYLDKDSDNDGIPDTLEGTSSADHDLDGIDNMFDADFNGDFDNNNDGIMDNWVINSPLPDTDGDTTPDYIDTDSDNDSIGDSIEAGSSGIDSNINNIDDHFDAAINIGTDSNADGILEDAFFDADGDGAFNHHDLDSDNDGIPDITEAGTFDLNNDALNDGNTLVSLPLPDSDSDLIPNYLEVDSNNDSVFDIAPTAFVAFDVNNDGRVDITNDPDQDGIDNSIDTAPLVFGLAPYIEPDLDGDGIPDSTDPDIDNDSISNLVEGHGDNDSDGIPNDYDLDSDNDGISDYVESEAPARIGDANTNGIDDSVDLLVTLGIDNNADGMDDLYLPIDTDRDTIANYLDNDSDNDNYGDRLETSGFTLSLLDSDLDGIDDIFDVDNTGGIDANNDGIADLLFALLDNDSDGVFNYLDADSDNDNIGDAEEGIADNDFDGVLNRYDRDSDNDGISDYIESGTPTREGDTNNNGLDDSIDVLITGGNDFNFDGLDDAFPPRDTDRDTIPDYLDVDSDNDTITDKEETSGLVLSGFDNDGDGIDNVFDVDFTGGVDANNDGIDDDVVIIIDTDGDGIPDYLDLDSDNDGFPDRVENDDTNRDGIPDRLQPEGKVKASSGKGATNSLLLLLLSMAMFLRRSVSIKAFCITVLVFIFSANLYAEEEIVCRDYKAWPEYNAAFAPCFYLGVGLGQSSLDPDTSDSSWNPLDSKDTAYSLFAGYHFAHSWFAEVMYADLGKVAMDNKHALVTAKESVGYLSYSAFAGYYLPADELFRTTLPVKFFIKAGIAQLENTSSSPLLRLEKDSQTVLATGAGIEWPFQERWMLRTEIDTFSAEATFLNISVAYWLGGKKHYYENTVYKTLEKVVPKVTIAEAIAQEVDAESSTALPRQEALAAMGDDDKDGVINTKDECPQTPPRFAVDKRGCSIFKGEFKSLYGAFNSTDLTYPSFALLDTIIALLKSYPDTRIEIQAHTDSRGTTEFNQNLSEQRAEVVKAYLVEKGIATKRIQTKGFGESQPISISDTPEGLSKNRRIDFIILNR
jgi:outer membrane protein OmpA-like peptidoglycan-associated protein